MLTIRRPIAAAIGGAAVTLLLLSGCSAGGQSKAQACASLEKDLQDAPSQLEDAVSEITTDPTAAAKKMTAFDKSFKTSVDKVNNADVKKAAEKTADSVDTLTAEMKKLSGTPSSDDLEALEKAATGVSDSFTALGKVCTA